MCNAGVQVSKAPYTPAGPYRDKKKEARSCDPAPFVGYLFRDIQRLRWTITIPYANIIASICMKNSRNSSSAGTDPIIQSSCTVSAHVIMVKKAVGIMSQPNKKARTFAFFVLCSSASANPNTILTV